MGRLKNIDGSPLSPLQVDVLRFLLKSGVECWNRDLHGGTTVASIEQFPGG